MVSLPSPPTQTVGATAAGELVVAGAAVERVVAVQRDRGGHAVADQFVDAVAAEQRVAAGIALQEVVALVTIGGIVAGAGQCEVVAAAAVERVAGAVRRIGRPRRSCR